MSDHGPFDALADGPTEDLADGPVEDPAEDLAGSPTEDPADDPAGDSAHDRAATERTGHPDVDAVIASLDDLDGRPVPEHVAVFESAHDRLRAALSDADAATPGPPA